MEKNEQLKHESAADQGQAKKNERRPLSKEVVIFGIVLIVSSISHMLKLFEERKLLDEYFSNLPVWLRLLRYSFSWFQRILGILAGCGILARKEIARKLAFAIGAFTLLTVYWKHPYEAVKLHCEALDKQLGHHLSQIINELATSAGINLPFSSLALLSTAGLILSDFVFWGAFFYCFTRPHVRDQFKPVA